jgi:hypothetical protein
MLSFDVSAIDIVLLVAVLVLFLLFISQRKSQSEAEPKPNIDAPKKLSSTPMKREKTATESSDKNQSPEGFRQCVHQFGYLKNMPKNTPVPDECFGCPKVLRCMFSHDEVTLHST